MLSSATDCSGQLSTPIFFLLAAKQMRSFDSSSGVLNISDVAMSGASITVAHDETSGMVTVNGVTTATSASQVVEIDVVTGMGDDQVDLSGISATSFPLLTEASVSTSDGNDLVVGSFVDNRIVGGLGDDVLTGGIASDFIQGGSGNDTIDGGEGDDHLYGDSGSDIIVGEKGNDVLLGGSDADNIDGGEGEDIMSGLTAIDFFNGGSDLDNIETSDDALAGFSVTGDWSTFSGSGVNGTQEVMAGGGKRKRLGPLMIYRTEPMKSS